MQTTYDCPLTQKTIIIFPTCEKTLMKEFSFISQNSPKQAEILNVQFRETIETIKRMPTMGTPYKNGMRRMKLGKFKYYVYYREKKTVIEIIGMLHTSSGTEFAG